MYYVIVLLAPGALALEFGTADTANSAAATFTSLGYQTLVLPKG